MAPITVPATGTESAAWRYGQARWSLKWRLSLLLAGLFISVFLLGSLAYVVSARQAIGSEARAVARLSEALLSSAPRIDGLPAVPLAALRGLGQARHLRVVVPDRSSGRPPIPLRTEPEGLPGWFAGIFREEGSAWSQRIIVLDPGHAPFAALLQATPEDELSEKWSDVVHAFWFLIVLLFVLNVGSWVIVSWQLNPLKTLRDALESVGSGERDVHVEPSAVKEVADVQNGFNRMAEALRAAAARNRRLTRELLRVQEDERRSIARELHDEFAQQLTAIDAEAAALTHGLREAPGSLASAMSIRKASQALMRMVRGRLEQLRPEVLDEFGVIAAIEELCDSYRTAHPELAVVARLPSELALGEERSIAVFRILQESLTNVVRHARASQVDIQLQVLAQAGERHLQLRVADNGTGLAAGFRARRGFGLIGMTERAESLGGSCRVGSLPESAGTVVDVSLPLGEGSGSA